MNNLPNFSAVSAGSLVNVVPNGLKTFLSIYTDGSAFEYTDGTGFGKTFKMDLTAIGLPFINSVCSVSLDESVALIFIGSFSPTNTKIFPFEHTLGTEQFIARTPLDGNFFIILLSNTICIEPV